MGLFDNIINEDFVKNMGKIIYEKLSKMSREEGIEFLRKALKESVVDKGNLAISSRDGLIDKEVDIDKMSEAFYDAIMDTKGECIVAVSKGNVDDILSDENIPDNVKEILKERKDSIEKLDLTKKIFLYTSIAMCRYFKMIIKYEEKLDLMSVMSFFVATLENFSEDNDSLFNAKNEILKTKINNIIKKEFNTQDDNIALGMALMSVGFNLLEKEDNSLIFNKDKFEPMIDMMIVESIKEIGVKEFLQIAKEETESIFKIFDIDINNIDSLKEKYKDAKKNNNLSDDDLKDILKK